MPILLLPLPVDSFSVLMSSRDPIAYGPADIGDREDQSLTIDGAASGAVAYGPAWARNSNDPAEPPLVIEVTNRHQSTVLATLDPRSTAEGGSGSTLHDYTFSDQLNDAGSATAKLLNDDPDVTLASNMARRLTWKLWGIPAFSSLVEQPDIDEISQNDEAGQTTAIGGRGHVALLDSALVYPPRRPIEGEPFDTVSPFQVTYLLDSPWGGSVIAMRATEDQTQADERHFNYAAVELNEFYAGWDDPVIYCQQQGPSDTRPPLPYSTELPSSWPDPEAWWTWVGYTGSAPVPVGDVYARSRFMQFTPGGVDYRVFATADDGIELWIDGVRLISQSQRGTHTSTITADFRGAFGQHLVSVKATNLDIGSPAGNIGNFIVSIWELDQYGNPSRRVLATDPDVYQWKGLAYPGRSPGFTPGQVIRHLVEDAQQDDRQGLQGITLGFNDLTDSDGEPWVWMPDAAFRIGMSVFEALRQLSETYIDFAMRPGSLVLDAWNFGGRGRTTSATYRYGESIMSLQRKVT